MTDSKLKLINNLKESKGSDSCFLIGGGPSVTKLIPDSSILTQHDVYVTNNAYKLFPNAILLHFTDQIWWEWHTDKEHDVENSFDGYISMGCKANIQYWNKYPRVTPFVCKTKGKESASLSETVGTIEGSNAGHQLINIAHQVGYKQLILIGYDLNSKTKQAQWHKDHRRETRTDIYDTVMIPGFNNISKIRKGIFNLNRDSAIRCFPFADLKDFI